MSQYKQFISEDEWNESEVNLCRRSRNNLFLKTNGMSLKLICVGVAETNYFRR
jgi:hypothetical protein